jgi:Na+-translocating ferredoxin:NAD+ oxidoreductase RnfC subunit
MQMNLADKIKAAGVAGAGGAGFPSHVKAASKVSCVIANGAECEPLLYSDQELMRLYPEKIVEGLILLRKSTGASDAFFATKSVYKDIVDLYEKIAEKLKEFKVFRLGNFYPSGDEHVLVHEVTGSVIPEGGIPLEIGAVVQNVQTLYQIADAARDIPVTRRMVTVTGEVNNPGVYELPLGTTLADAIYLASGLKRKDVAIIEGGPMMGILVNDDSVPVKKTTSGFIVLPEDHVLVKRRKMPFSFHLRMTLAACCQCRECTDLCPRHLLGHSLEPHKVMRAFYYGMDEPAEQITQAFLCCLCNVCETYACNMGLSPRLLFADLREKLPQKGVKNPHRKKIEKPLDEQKFTRVPKDRLIPRLGLEEYSSHLHFI